MERVIGGGRRDGQGTAGREQGAGGSGGERKTREGDEVYEAVHTGREETVADLRFDLGLEGAGRIVGRVVGILDVRGLGHRGVAVNRLPAYGFRGEMSIRKHLLRIRLLP